MKDHAKDYKNTAEYNPLIKKWRKGIKRVALVYPNAYISGIANIGLQQIYAEINSINNFICERFYYDFFKCRRSFETGAMLEDFDILLFSLQYEEDYLKVVEIINYLRKSGFRGITIAGGPCILENPIPLAYLFDYFYIGEIDCDVRNMLESIFDEYTSDKYLIDSKAILDFSEDITKKGVKFKIKARKAKLDTHLESQIVGNGVYGRCYLLEIGRGCKRSCSFCVVRQIYSPCRWRNPKLLIEIAEKAKNIVNKVALISPSVTDHPDVKEIMWELVNMGLEVSPSSMRADTIDEEIAEILAACGQKSVTIAPEAGSNRMRTVLRKGISEDDIFYAVECVKDKGIKNIKLYYMVGIPGENFEDVEAIVRLTKKVKESGVRVAVSVNPLVPKPHTPLQFAPFGGVNVKNEKEVKNIGYVKSKSVKSEFGKILKNKVNYLSKSFKKLGISGNVEKPENFAIQTILSRGDKNVASYLAYTLSRGEFNRNKFLRDFSYLLGELSTSKFYHWEFIDHGYNIKRLRKEYDKLMEISCVC